MALEFKSKLDAINFGGLVVEPKLDVETRMRLQNIKLDNIDGVKEAIHVMATCFGDNAEKVEEFISSNMGIDDIARLQVYLVGGQNMLDRVNAKMDEVYND